MYNLTAFKKSLLYASNTFLSAVLCWYGLILLGIQDPIWGIITVVFVSDPDFKNVIHLSKIRGINTIAGGFIGITSLLLFGYSPLNCFFTISATVLLITSISHYPSNWRLAPATVIILMDAGRQASGQAAEIHDALARALEIGFGCLASIIIMLLHAEVALLLKQHYRKMYAT